MNAVYCVGNYAEIFYSDNDNRGMNQINNGTTGMLFATPFGELDTEGDNPGVMEVSGTLFDKIRQKRLLNCGVVVPADFDGEIENLRELAGMSVDYCQTVAAALFYGDYERVNLITFPESDNSSYASLDNGTIDVLAGGRVERRHDFGSPPSLGGVQFSTPYFYGNETAGDGVSFFALATRDDDLLFTSFVNCVVLATIYAQEIGIKEKHSKRIPLASIFGSELKWALRDAISYFGRSDEIYAKHFVNSYQEMAHSFIQSICQSGIELSTQAEVVANVISDQCRDDMDKKSRENIGRNDLNSYGSPQILSFPGLSP